MALCHRHGSNAPPTAPYVRVRVRVRVRARVKVRVKVMVTPVALGAWSKPNLRQERSNICCS